MQVRQGGPNDSLLLEQYGHRSANASQWPHLANTERMEPSSRLQEHRRSVHTEGKRFQDSGRFPRLQE